MSTPPAARLPSNVEPLRIDTGSGELAALRCGDARHPAVVMVPGFTGSKEDFVPILTPLMQAGLHVTAIDQRGQYESAWEADPGAFTLADFTADLLGLIESAPEPVHLVGHSFGGLVAREATIAAPERVASLTLMDSGPGALPQDRWLPLQALIGMVPVATMDQIWAAKLELDRMEGAPPIPAELEPFLRERWVANSGWSMAGIAEILMSVSDRTDELRDVLASHERAALVMFGEWDETAWPITQQVEMAARLSARAVPIPQAAHSPAVENPAATVAQLVGFITSTNV